MQRSAYQNLPLDCSILPSRVHCPSPLCSCTYLHQCRRGNLRCHKRTPWLILVAYRPRSTREATVHIIHRIPIPESKATDRTIPWVPSSHGTRSATVGRLTLPTQAANGELHIVVCMLSRDDEGIRELANERVRFPIIHRVADGMLIVFDGLSDHVLIIVIHLHVSKKVFTNVRVAVFCLGEMERACASSVSRR